jgi:hypothetical protein
MGLRAYQIDPDAAIEKRMIKTISDLSTIQAFRDQPFEAFQNFQAKYPAEKIQNFFDTIRPIFEGKSYGVEFEYLVRTRIKKAQMTVRMPEQEFICKRALVLPIGFLVPCQWLTVV